VPTFMSTRDQDAASDVIRSLGAAAIGGRLRRLSERIDEDCARIYAESGIEFEQRWLGVIYVLAQSGPQSVGALAAKLGISHASISQSRKSLQKAGLILAEVAKTDARSVRVRLSSAGRRLYSQVVPILEILKRISVEANEEAGQPLAAIERMEQAMNRMSLYDRYQSIVRDMHPSGPTPRRTRRAAKR
jgi:MarR family transcriptional regulator, organic hydroperoxide resistance regulator